MTNNPLPYQEKTSPAVISRRLSRRGGYLSVNLGEGLEQARNMGTCLVKHNGRVVMATILFVFHDTDSLTSLENGTGLNEK